MAEDDRGLTDDAFLGGRLNILQPKAGFRAGVDSVFLAAAVPARPGQKVFEAGTGPGVAALCLAARVKGLSITGMEAHAPYARLAQANAARNRLAEALRVIHGDVRRALKAPPVVEPGSFDHAFANPPYFEAGSVLPPQGAEKQAAHVFAPEDLDAWLRVMAALLRHRGTLTVIYPARHLQRLLSAFAGRLGGLRIMPLYPAPGAAARRVIVQGAKGSRAPLTLLPGLVLHESDGGFTPAAEAVLRHGAAFPLEES